MTERERLIELIANAPKIDIPFGSRAQGKTYQTIQNITDYLLANGVIVPPCKVGDVVYIMRFPSSSFYSEATVKAIYFAEDKKYYPKSHIIVQHDMCRGRTRYNFRDFGKTVFLTREEAEKALAERRMT